MAEEITKWMQQNAPWQDRQVIVYRDSRGRRRKKKGGAARRNLRARNVLGQGELDQKIDYEYALGAAREADRKRLRQINAERRKSATTRTSTDRQGNVTTIVGGAGAPRTVEEFKKIDLARVPQKESQVYALNKRFEKERIIATHIRVSHGNRRLVPYAVWLEIANNGRYSIIGPTMDHWGPLLMRKAKRLANLKQFSEMNFDFPKSDVEAFEVERRFYEAEGNEPWSQENHDRILQDRKDRRRRARNRAIREAGGTVPQKDIRPRGPHFRK